MKRMGWGGQMRGLKTIDQAHVLSGDKVKGVGTIWRPMKRMRSDASDQMRGLKTIINQAHVLSGDG